MMRSLYSGVAGLKSHQTKMDVIGNNIANVNTVAFKSSSVSFSEIMYQTTQSATGANTLTGTGGVNAKQIGLGVTVGTTKMDIDSTGATQTTGNALDVMLSGNSFFIVSNGSSNQFTRAGSFYFDGVGNLAMASTGYNVMGWQVDQTTGDIKKDSVSPLRIMQTSNLTSAPEATSQAVCAGILDSNASAVTTDDGYVMSLSFYDRLGYQYTAKYKVTAGDDDGEYNVALTDILDQNSESILDGTDIGAEDLSGVAYPGKSDTGTLVSGFTMESSNITDSVGTTATKYLVKNADGDVQDDSYLYVGSDGKYCTYNAASDILTPLSSTNASYKDAIADEIDHIEDVYSTYFTGISSDLKVTGSSSFSDSTQWNHYINLDGNNFVLDDDKAMVKTAGLYDQYDITNASDGSVISTFYVDSATNKFCNSTGGALTALELTDLTAAIKANTTSTAPSTYTIAADSVISQSEVIDGNSSIDITGTEYYQVLSFDTDDGSFKNIGGADTTTLAMSNFGKNFDNISVDFSQVTMYNNGGTSTMSMSKGAVDGSTGTGKKLGALTGVTIDTSGIIYGSYDNGNTVALGQIAVAGFANASGLEKVGENCYQTTLNSGEFNGIGVDITADGGSMTTGALEMSNVDLSSEFTEMITTQRGFQANSKIITTSDTLLEELINLKR